MKRIALCAALCALLVPSAANAAGGPGYTYTISGTGTGSVAGTTFNALPLTLSFTDATPGTVTLAGVNVYDTAPEPTLSFLWGDTSGSFNENGVVRDNQNVSIFALRIGSSINSAFGLDIVDAFFGSYNLTGPALVTPIASNAFLNIADRPTSAGAFTLTRLTNITFRAGVVAVVPEANTFALALPALGMVGAVVLKRRKR